MGKNANFVSHKKSKLKENGGPKLPLASDIVEGEIAINFGKDVETLSIKNESGDVVTFSSDNYYTEKKLGSGFTGENSANTVTSVVGSGFTSSSITDVIIENEEIVSAALTDLDERKLDASAYTPSVELWVSGTGENAIAQKGGGNTASGKLSVAMGSGTTASGDLSVAEGENTLASGRAAHAEGNGTSGTGYFSHAEGLGTRATSNFDHAEGNGTLASGTMSHAEGYYTVASGYTSHAEGNITLASGMFSHAEGYSTSATSSYAHSEGNTTKATAMSSHAEGNGTLASGDNSHAEGQGTSASGNNSHAEGQGTSASGWHSHAEGQGTSASGSSSHAEGLGTIANGMMSHAEGHATIVNNKSEHASGQYNISSSGSSTFGHSGNTLFSVGNGTANDARHNAFEIRQNGDIYIVNKNGQDVKLQDEIGNITIDQVIDSGTSASTDAVSTSAVYDFVTSYTPSITVDQVLDNTTSASTNPVSSKAVYDAVTDNELVWTNAYVTLSGTVSAHTENTEIHVTAADKTAWNAKLDASAIADFFDDAKYEDSGNTKVINFYNGNTLKATIDATDFIVDGMVESVSAGTSGNTTVLDIKWNTAAGGQETIIDIGDIFEAENYYTTGQTSGATELSTAFSNKLDSSAYTELWVSGTGLNSVAQKGGGNTASGKFSVAIGSGTTASGDFSHAEGKDTSATTNFSHTEGQFTLAVGGGGEHAEGYYSSAITNYSHAEGQYTYSVDNSHTEGYKTSGTVNSHAEGYQSNGMQYSHAEGGYTIASNYSHTEGYQTTGNTYSHAEGYQTSAYSYSHAEGYVTKARLYSHAEGYQTSATSSNSHSEGLSTIASGMSSHAEGSYTKAIGENSHAEGYETVANGNKSHTEGQGTIASGESSHAEGRYTEAKNPSEHASGQYNISNSASTTFGDSGNTLFSIGNGTAYNARHNAFEIRQNGDIYISSGGTDIKLQDNIGKVETVTAITPSNSGSTEPIATKVVAENELTVSNALIDLDERKLDASAYTPTDLSNYYTKSETSGATEISTALGVKSDTGHTHEASGVTAMTGYQMAASSASVLTTDTLLQVIGKLEKRISLLETSVADLNSQSETVATALVELHSEIGDIETLLSQI